MICSLFVMVSFQHRRRPEVGASFIFNSSWDDRDRCILCMETFTSRWCQWWTCRFHRRTCSAAAHKQLIMCELRHVGVLAGKTQFWMYMQMKHWLMILFRLLNTPSMPEVRRQPLELAKRPYLDAMYAGIRLRCTTRHVQCVYHTTPGKWWLLCAVSHLHASQGA